MTRLVALVLCIATTAAACAPARAQVATQPAIPAPPIVDPGLMASYVSQLPLGARVRVSLTDGRVVRGTLMRGNTDPIVVQRRTRIPEPPLNIPIREVQALELETKNGGPGRAIAVGAAAGAASALGVLMLLVAIFAD